MNAKYCKFGKVFGNATVYGNAKVFGDARVDGFVKVDESIGLARVDGFVKVDKYAEITPQSLYQHESKICCDYCGAPIVKGYENFCKYCDSIIL